MATDDRRGKDDTKMQTTSMTDLSGPHGPPPSQEEKWTKQSPWWLELADGLEEKIAPTREWGKRLRAKLDRDEMSSDELASLIGVSSKYINKLEKGRRARSKHIIAICIHMEIEPPYAWIMTKATNRWTDDGRDDVVAAMVGRVRRSLGKS